MLNAVVTSAVPTQDRQSLGLF